MKTIYVANDGKKFTNKEKCKRHENGLLKIKKIFYKLVDENFFENYKIVPFVHNHEVTNLGKPRKSDWKDHYRGYILVHGRMGNGDTIVTFKLRKNKLLIFRYDTDDYYNGKRYMGSINIENPRRLKIKKILKEVQNVQSDI